MRLLVESRTDVGRVRAGNEDALHVADDARVVAVADGMGGHQAGEVASATAIAALQESLAGGAAVGDAVSNANDAVVAKAADDSALRGMGTTLTVGVLDGTTLVIGHVGDSRAYLLRAGTLRQVTTDHSVVAELVATGEITEAEALTDPRRAMITRVVGIESPIEVDVLPLELEPGDRLLLCSDGLTTMVRDDAIAEILATEDDRSRAADELVQAANLAGGADNITVLVADVVADEPPTEPASDESGGPTLAAAMADTAETPAVTEPPPVTDEIAAAVDPDADLAEVRAAVEATAPRRRWWPRRSKS